MRYSVGSGLAPKCRFRSIRTCCDMAAATGRLTSPGWQRFEDLKRAHVSSSFAFFARKFDNPDLDQIYNTCLLQAVKDTGYELRTVTQRAGLIDAIIETEIPRCRFLIADLSDSNAGAYSRGQGRNYQYPDRVRYLQ